MAAKKFVIILMLLLSCAVYGQTLIVEAIPAFSESGFVQNNGKYYLLAEIQNIDTSHTGTFGYYGWDEAQYQSFYYIGPDDSVTCQITAPVSGNYKIYTRLCQHGNSGPRAYVYVDGSYKNEISGNRTWGSTSVYLSAGTHSIRYEESGTGDATYPLRLVGFDAVAVSNDLSWVPPSTLSEHPYTGNDYWWERPSQQLTQIQVSAGGKTATYSGQWNYKDILLVDDTGASQGTASGFSASGDSLAGQNLSAATVSSNTNKRTNSSARILTRNNSRISPNYDLNYDDVSLDIPSGQYGYVKIKYYNDSTVRQMTNGLYTWDGRKTNDIYSDFAQKLGYLLEFTPTSGGSIPLLACVYSNPTEASLVYPRVREISPNDDDVYDTVTVYLNSSAGFSYGASDTVVVKDSSGSVVKNLSKTSPINWDGTNNGGQLCSAGKYTVEILNSSSQLRAGSQIAILNLPPTDQGPHNPGDLYVLGMWTAFSGATTTSEMDAYAAMNCNAFRYADPGTYGTFTSRSASSFWSSAEFRNLKVLVNLNEVVDYILALPIAPSEPHLEAILSPWVNPIKNRSGLLGYELKDEPGYVAEHGYRLRAIQQILHKLDPDHPSAPILIGYDDRISQYTADMQPQQLLLDLYPCRDHDGTKDTHDQPGDFRNIWGYNNLEMMQYLDWAMNFVEPRGVPTWIIHQAHLFSDGLDEPTPEEIRLQVWLCLSRAIKGSFFFIWESQQGWTGVKDNPAIKTAISNIYGRLKAPAVYSVLPHLQKDTFNVSITGGGNSYGYASGVATALTDGTKKYIIAANRNCTGSSNITINSTAYPTASLKDLETGTQYAMGQTISFPAGDGKIFELVIEALTPPNAPRNLSFSDVTEKKLRLSWQSPLGGSMVSGYKIYDTTGSIYQVTASLSYTFTNLNPGQEYCFFVKAYNSSGDSPASETACQETFAHQNPTMPDELKIADYSASQVQIQWEASTDNIAVSDYDVYRNEIFVGKTSDTYYTFGDCFPESRYEFKVRANDVDGGSSELTPVVCVVTCQAGGVPTELQGHWKFNENSGSTAADSSTYSRNGTVNNCTWTTGYFNSALDFNGSTSNVNLGSFNVVGNQLTVTAWINADAFNFSADNRIISKAVGSGEEDHYWMVSTVSNTGAVRLRFRLRTNGDTLTLKGESQDIPTGQWIHIAAVYDGSTMKLYKNAVADSKTVSKTGNIENGSSVSVLIGANPANYSVWDGKIDDVRIYDRALTASQLEQVMNGEEPFVGAGGECNCNNPADFNCDCVVDFTDFTYINKSWQGDAFASLGDMVEDDIVDFQDLLLFVNHWLSED